MCTKNLKFAEKSGEKGYSSSVLTRHIDCVSSGTLCFQSNFFCPHKPKCNINHSEMEKIWHSYTDLNKNSLWVKIFLLLVQKCRLKMICCLKIVSLIIAQCAETVAVAIAALVQRSSWISLKMNSGCFIIANCYLCDTDVEEMIYCFLYHVTPS